MKCIFEYVNCCITSTPCDNEEPPSARRRRPTRGTTSAADWRPSLFAITEDNAVAAAPEKKKPENVHRQRSTRRRNVNRCGALEKRVNTPSRSYDFSHDPLPLVIPAFSAAPFMF